MEPHPPRYLTDRQEDALLAAVTAGSNYRDRTLLVLMLHTGLRAHEACTLKQEHVYLGPRNKYREVPLNATARAALEGYLPTVHEDDGSLFPSTRTGRALTEPVLGQLVMRYAEKAKLPVGHRHAPRHRFGYPVADTVPLHGLAQIMGHDSLDTTRIYTQGTQSDLQIEVEKIAWT